MTANRTIWLSATLNGRVITGELAGLGEITIECDTVEKAQAFFSHIKIEK